MYNSTLNLIREITYDVIDKSKLTSYNNDNTYINSVPYEKRCAESNKIINKYPNHVPVIINCLSDELKLKKTKYLVPKELHTPELMHTVRSQLKLDAGKAIFLFVNNLMVDNTKNIGEIYYEYIKSLPKDNKDLFLYISICAENTFG